MRRYGQLQQAFLTQWLTPDWGITLRQADILAELESEYQQIVVIENPVVGRAMLLNDVLALTEQDAFIFHEAMVHLAAITHPQPQRVVILGGGDGGVVHQVLKHPDVRAIEVCELDAAVVAMADEYFASVHQQSLFNPRVKVHFDDAVWFVERYTETVDLLFLDMSRPIGYHEPVFDEKFYSHCARMIGDLGVMVMHLGAFHYIQPRIQETLRQLQHHFQVIRPILIPMPHYGGYWVMVLVSQLRDARRITADAAAQRLQDRGIAQLQFYNGEMHQALLAIPNYLRPAFHLASHER